MRARQQPSHRQLLTNTCHPEAGDEYVGIKGLNLTLTYDTAEEARPIFEALADGGKISMPFGETLWAKGAGMVTDRFGTPWIVNGRSVANAASA